MALRSHLKLMQGTMVQTKVQVEMIIQVDYEQITLGHIANFDQKLFKFKNKICFNLP